MLPLQQLVSFHIIEQDVTAKTYMTWTYPTISDSNKFFLLKKLSASADKPLHFVFLRNKTDFLYVTCTDTFDIAKLARIKRFFLVLIATDFNPDKYETLGRILSKCYCRTDTPVELVKLYLSVYTTGACSTQENGTFVLREIDNGYGKKTTKIKELINMFGLEIILIYTGILLKKRVAVYHHSLEILLKWIATIPTLMLHRCPDNYLFPIMDLNLEDMKELKMAKHFVAGFTDSAICSKTDVYDLLVNLPACEISITAHAKECLTMTKTHKDIAMFMVQLAANSDVTEVQIVKEIANKSQELLSYLRSLSADKAVLSLDDIKMKNLHPAVENFLLNLALAENLLIF
ncbi:hypothetical protein CBL_10287 [Carabus blaptoides fortunei]